MVVLICIHSNLCHKENISTCQLRSFTHTNVGTVWAERADMILSELSRHLTDFDYVVFNMRQT